MRPWVIFPDTALTCSVSSTCDSKTLHSVRQFFFASLVGTMLLSRVSPVLCDNTPWARCIFVEPFLCIRLQPCEPDQTIHCGASPYPSSNHDVRFTSVRLLLPTMLSLFLTRRVPSGNGPHTATGLALCPRSSVFVDVFGATGASGDSPAASCPSPMQKSRDPHM